MRLSGLEYELPGCCRVERRVDKHLERNPVQVGLPLTFQGEAVLQVLGAHHVLEHGVAIWAIWPAVWPETEDDERLPEDRVLCVEGEDLHRDVRPVSHVRKVF